MDTPGPGPLHVLVITLTLLTPHVDPCPLTTFPDSWSGADVPGTFYPFGSAEGDTVREGTFEGWGNDNEQLYEDDDLVTIDLSTQVSLPFLGRLESQVTVSTFFFFFFPSFFFLQVYFGFTSPVHLDPAGLLGHLLCRGLSNVRFFSVSGSSRI